MKLFQVHTQPISDAPIHTEAATPSISQAAQRQQLQQLQDGVYEVRPGDTLYAIAHRFLGDGNRYTELAQLNGIQNANLISVGQQLQLPQAESSEKSEVVFERDSSMDHFGAFRSEFQRFFALNAPKAEAAEKDLSEGNSSLESTPLYQAIEEFAQRFTTPGNDAGRTDWKGWCAATMAWFVQGSYSDGSKGYGNGTGRSASAEQARGLSGFDELPLDAPQRTSSLAPKGAFHWWKDSGFGHVGLDVAGGGTDVFMATSYEGPDVVELGHAGKNLKLVKLDKYNQAHPHLHYQGWTTQFVGASVDPELLKAADEL